MENKVVITGMGIVSSIGKNMNEFLKSLHDGHSGLKWTGENLLKVAGTISNFSLNTQLKNMNIDDIYIKKIIKIAGRMPMYVQFSIVAVLEAWKNAGFLEDKLNTKDIAIIVAGNNLGQKYIYDTIVKYNKLNNFVNPTYAFQFLDTNIIGVLSEILSINAEGMTIGGSSASGNMAIINAFRMIKAGAYDKCVIVGPVFEYSPIELQAFSNIGVIGVYDFEQPYEASRPFDKGHRGFVPGQAAGCIILESEKSANIRGAKILAEIKGGAIVLDANHLPSASQSGEEKAMMKAIKESGINKEEINYINAHGTSTPSGDKIEADAIANLFGNNVLVNSTKSLTGHCMYSAAIIEAIACVLQMKYKFVHMNKNLKNAIREDINFAYNMIENIDIHYALSNSIAFGGINTSIVLYKR